MQSLQRWIALLEQAVEQDDPATIKTILRDAVPEFRSSAA
jgi:O-antigen biosynthesis protein WbqV